MLCSNCLSNEATFHYKYIKNGRGSEVHLCQSCARHLGYIKETNKELNPMGFLGELFSVPGFMMPKGETPLCPNCHTTFDRIRRTGFVGCDKCYDTFAKSIDEILSKIQPDTTHKGKLRGAEGKKIERDNTLKNLKEELNRAILDENYEHAAVIRDKIKKFENGKEGQNG